MAPRPKVTVLMSAYNAERYVAEAVDSVLAQTFSDLEFLIFEDASTDRTREILRGYSDPRIRLVENYANLGLTRNLQRGMLMARGEFVARMDADDVCMPQRLARQFDYLGTHPEIAVLGSAVTFFGEGRDPFFGYQPLEHDEIKCALLYGFTMLHPTVMIRKAAFEANDLNYDTAFPVSQDHDLWVRAIRKVGFANLRDPLLDLRVHSGKIGATQDALQKEHSDEVRRRQLVELGVTATTQEIRALGEHTALATAWTKSDLKSFESVLLKIIAANSTALAFNHNVLRRMGANSFRGTCRQLLIARNDVGRLYWQSPLRQYVTPSSRQSLGMIVRTLLSTLPARR